MVDNSDSAATSTVLYVIVVVVAVLVASVLAPVVYAALQGSGDEERPGVAVLTLRGGTSDANVNAIAQDLREARTNESIDAVVLRIDSPGGAVDSSERFYLAMNRTASVMPVVAYVEGTAASGGYYGISAADAIYVGPSSTVGSVGVIVQSPLGTVEQEEQLRQSFVRSGPDKAMITKDSIRNEMEMLQNAFVNTIMHERGETIDAGRTEVANANTYLGTVAVQNGFADAIGSTDSAIEHAADSAGVAEEGYDVVYKEPPTTGQTVVLSQDDVERVDGNIVYVADDDPDDEFVPPVKYYAVWGVPAESVDATADQEVTTNASN